MNEQKMREAFEAWCRSGDGPALFNGGVVCDDDTKDLLRHWMECTWIAATATTQRDAMDVAEAVRVAMVQSCESWPGIVEATKRVDLAAIVKAVRPSKPEPVNQQLLAALKDIGNDYADRFDIASSSTNPGIKIVIEQARAAIAAAEAAQPASAQQQGEPVAWMYDWVADDEHGKSVIRDWVSSDYDVAHSELDKCHNIRPLYPAPPAPACSVPGGWQLVPVEPTSKMIVAGAETDPQFFQHAQFVWRAMLAAAPKPKGGA